MKKLTQIGFTRKMLVELGYFTLAVACDKKNYRRYADSIVRRMYRNTIKIDVRGRIITHNHKAINDVMRIEGIFVTHNILKEERRFNEVNQVVKQLQEIGYVLV